MKAEMMMLCPEEGESLKDALRAIADHHDECVNSAWPDDCIAADYHHERAEWARDLADYVSENCAVGEIDRANVAGELRKHRERLADATQAMKERGDFCQRMERRFNGEAVET